MTHWTGRWRHRLAVLPPRYRLLLAMLLGGLTGGAMAPFFMVFLLIPGIAGLVWLLSDSRRPGAAFAIGWAFGVGHFTVGFYWVGYAFLVDAAQYGWMAPIAVVGLAAGIALFIGAAGLVSWLVGKWLHLNLIGLVLMLASSWTFFEWVRSWLFTGFPWNLIGTVWAFADGMMQFAAFGGIYGLGLVTLIAAGMPAVLAEVDHPRRAIMAVILTSGALMAIWGMGEWRLMAAPESDVAGVRLRLVQPAIPQQLKWKSGYKVAHVRKQVELSRQPSADGLPPTLVIWAETAVPFNVGSDPRLIAYLGSAAPDNGFLITGAPRATPPGEQPLKYWNSLVAISPQGTLTAVYDKTHLVPFGEYVPFRSVLPITKLTAGRTDFSPGTGTRVWNLSGLPPLAPLICYEAIFPAEVRAVGPEPKWLLNVTNDAWFGLSAGPYQHFAAVRFRAVEMGLPLVRVANTGISAVVDAYGRIRAQLGLGLQGVVDSPLPEAISTPPLYRRFGDGITFFLVLTATITACFSRLTSDQKRP